MGRIKKEDSKIKSITVKVDSEVKEHWDKFGNKKIRCALLRMAVYNILKNGVQN